MNRKYHSGHRLTNWKISKSRNGMKYAPDTRPVVPYINGAPLGSDRKCYVKHMLNTMKLYDSVPLTRLNQTYSYSNLRVLAPWANTFRAGIVLLYKTPEGIKLLLVKHNKTHYYNHKGEYCVQALKGPPKGQAEDTDTSAFDTAIREMHEEIGIDICNPIYDVKLSHAAYVIPRKQITVNEVHVYFIAIVEKEPQIIIDKNEITGYEWVNINHGIKHLFPEVSNTTKHLLVALSNTNLQSIDLNLWISIN